MKRLIAENPEAVRKYRLDQPQNLVSAGGGFGPVSII